MLLVLTDASSHDTEQALTLALLGHDIGVACTDEGEDPPDETIRVAILRILNLRRTWLKATSTVKVAVEALDVWAKENVVSVLRWVSESRGLLASQAAVEGRVLRLQHPDTQAATAGGRLTIQAMRENNLPSLRSRAQMETSRAAER